MRYVVISVDENPQYLYYLPLVVFAWRYLGWEPILFYTGNPKFISGKHQPTLKYKFDSIEGYRSDTIAQVSRLYAGCLPLDGDPIIMTSDIDMLPLCVYWQPKDGMITTYGHDLTAFQHVPMCYVAMNRTRWVEVMGLTNSDYNALLKRDLGLFKQAHESTDPVKRWVVDQDIITHRIEQTEFKRENVARGTLHNGYPVGRVDRSAWTLEHPTLIDCHMSRNIFDNATEMINMLHLLNLVWPTESWEWLFKYTDDFRSAHGI